jgi:acyl carrier protein
MEPYTQELRQFIIDNFLFGDQSGRFAFSNSDSLQELGIVDSTGVLELVCHLQERYAIAVADEDLVPDNLDSVDRIAHFLERKRGEAPVVRAS